MAWVLELLLAFLCVIGVVCLIRSAYDELYREEAEQGFSLRLTFQGNGRTEKLEYILKKAKYWQATFYPGMQICFLDTGDYETGESRPARRICEALQIQYYGDMIDEREEMDMPQRHNGSGGLPQ